MLAVGRTGDPPDRPAPRGVCRSLFLLRRDIMLLVTTSMIWLSMVPSIVFVGVVWWWVAHGRRW